MVYKLSRVLGSDPGQVQHFFTCWLHRWRSTYLHKQWYWLVL